MKKTLIATALAAAFLVPATSAMADDAPAAPASPVTFNVGVVSDYIFRGISQTHGDAAIQGGIDYADPSGFYLGTWLSSISFFIASFSGPMDSPSPMTSSVTP